MKTRVSLLGSLAFLLAIGSALASEYLFAEPAWTMKSDVPGQVSDCVQRQSCSGSGELCSITFNNQGVAITVPAYDGETQSETSCGDRLLHTP